MSTNYLEAQSQEANIQAPRRGQVVALGVDNTPRFYDLSLLAFNGQAWRGNVAESLFLTLQNDSATVAIYYYFSSTGVSDIDPAVFIAAGGAMAFNTSYSAVLGVASSASMRILRPTDRYLCVRAASAAILRFFASSDSTPQAQ